MPIKTLDNEHTKYNFDEETLMISISGNDIRSVDPKFDLRNPA
jgi:hypothetical protein